MKEFDIRYVYRHKKTGEIVTYIDNIITLEKGSNKNMTTVNNGVGYELISRDLFTGLIDENGKQIFENDIVNCDGNAGLVLWSERNLCWDVKFENKDDEDFSWHDRLSTWKDKAWIIGNIYEK
ncbi:YopX family protein [Bacillus licheniformis]|uniref:YopX family protein n=1 Tax=Bacillus licheniformis TaxID=1402 RepID=UPI00237D08D7|nr:YopX family protein [Bacillus licheniformis]MDE1367515.1 YopX family protein [Bacillus licheniformis]